MRSDARLLLLDRDQVAALLQADAVTAAVQEAFLLHSSREGRTFPLVREALPGGAVFGIKAGDAASQALLGFKAAGFWPVNRDQGADAHQATIMLLDPASGRPLCLLDGNAITTARTAAAGAIGLMQLARPDSTRLCVFGTGVQAAAHVGYALSVLPNVTTVRYLTSDGQREMTFERRFADRCDIAPGINAAEAVAASDIIITATPGAKPLFPAEAVQPGTHLNCVGADTRGKRELPAGLLEHARIWVDDLAQARSVGELQWTPDLDAQELGKCLMSGRPARSATDITLFDMTGLALQDLTVARMLYRSAIKTGTGTSIPWPW
jgi:ornithine cyclodeaminase